MVVLMLVMAVKALTRQNMGRCVVVFPLHEPLVEKLPPHKTSEAVTFNVGGEVMIPKRPVTTNTTGSTSGGGGGGEGVEVCVRVARARRRHSRQDEGRAGTARAAPARDAMLGAQCPARPDSG